jgi:hypothetical protein
MASATNSLFASSRRSRALGLLIAAGVLFIATVGGSSALYGAYTGVAQTHAAAAARVAA